MLEKLIGLCILLSLQQMFVFLFLLQNCNSVCCVYVLLGSFFNNQSLVLAKY